MSGIRRRQDTDTSPNHEDEEPPTPSSVNPFDSPKSERQLPEIRYELQRNSTLQSESSNPNPFNPHSKYSEEFIPRQGQIPLPQPRGSSTNNIFKSNTPTNNSKIKLRIDPDSHLFDDSKLLKSLSPAPLVLNSGAWPPSPTTRLSSKNNVSRVHIKDSDIELNNLDFSKANAEAQSKEEYTGETDHGISFINPKRLSKQHIQNFPSTPVEDNSTFLQKRLKFSKEAAKTMGTKMSVAFKAFADVVNANEEEMNDDSDDEDIDDIDDEEYILEYGSSEEENDDIQLISSHIQSDNLSDVDSYHNETDAYHNDFPSVSSINQQNSVHGTPKSKSSKFMETNDSIYSSPKRTASPIKPDYPDQLKNRFTPFEQFINSDTEDKVSSVHNNQINKLHIPAASSSYHFGSPVLASQDSGSESGSVVGSTRSRSLTDKNGAGITIDVQGFDSHDSLNSIPLSSSLRSRSRSRSRSNSRSSSRASDRRMVNIQDNVSKITTNLNASIVDSKTNHDHRRHIDFLPQSRYDKKLFGKSFRIFDSKSKIRRRCYDYVTNSTFEKLIAALILTSVIIINIQQLNIESGYVYLHKYSKYDWILFIIYNVFTLEMIMKSIAYGFYDDKEMFAELEIQNHTKRTNYLKKLGRNTKDIVKSIKRKDYMHRLKKKLESEEVKEEYDYTQKYDDEEDNDGRKNHDNVNNLLGLNIDTMQGHKVVNQYDIESMGVHSKTTTDDKEHMKEQESNVNIPHSVTILKLNSKPAKPIRAYLRFSWHRVDFVSIVSFWIGFLLSMNHTDLDHEILLFRSLMCIKLYRLLNLSDSSSLILKSLRRTAAEAKNVFLLLFSFWFFFAIIGVQSFKTSLRRTCVWEDPTDSSNTYNNEFQFCGSYLNTSGETMPYLLSDGSSSGVIKGFTCPVNSKCILGENPYGGTIGFDNIATSMEMVFVIISANTFTDIMYYTMDSDSMASSIFFIVSIFILSVWLINLIVAVVINAYKVNIEKLRKSTVKKKKTKARKNWKGYGLFIIIDLLTISKEKKEMYQDLRKNDKYIAFYYKIRRVFVGLIIVDFIIQCLRTSDSTDKQLKAYYTFEVGTTLTLLGEIIIRFTLFERVNWKVFFYSLSNWMDLFLAICSSIIIIPQIHKADSVYWWLSGFQIARFYRVVTAITVLQESWSTILRGFRSIMELCVFFLMTLYITSLVMSRLFEGIVPITEYDNGNQLIMNTQPNCLLSLYVITSTENWTDILYVAQQYCKNGFTLLCVAVYLVAWFILSNTIILNFLIAIITQNLGVAEHDKIKEQIKQAYNRSEDKHVGFLDRFLRKSVNLYDITVSKRETQKEIRKLVEYLRYDPQELLVKPELDKKKKQQSSAIKLVGTWLYEIYFINKFINMFENSVPGILSRKLYHGVQKIYNRIRGVDPLLGDLEGGLLNNSNGPPSPSMNRSRSEEGTSRDVAGYSESERDGSDTHSRSDSLSSTEDMFTYRRATEIVNPFEESENVLKEKLDYLRYDVSLYLFPVDHPVRKFCQKIVPVPYGGKRIAGEQPREVIKDIFAISMFIASVVVIVIACYTTPIYQKSRRFQSAEWSWLTISDFIFALIFTVEFLIKIIADGFIASKHAYMKSFFDRIDFFVLISFWVSFGAEMSHNASIYTIFSALKATRGLRLLTITRFSYDTFNMALLSSVKKIMAAALVALSLLIPFSLWGMNIYAGTLGSCLDGVSTRADCVLEYNNTVFDWDILSPNAYTEPYFEFNSFRKSILSLFLMLSLEGWVDTLVDMMNSTGIGTPPSYFSNAGGGLFVVIYNFIGIIFILNLFISIIINNYSVESGTAYLTEEQQGWYEVQKVLSQVKASKRRDMSDLSPLKKRIYNLVVAKNKAWTFVISLLLFIHVIGLVLEYYPDSNSNNNIRYAMFITSTFGLLINQFLCAYAIGFKVYYSNRWNIAKTFILLGAAIMSIISFFVSRRTTYANINKLFLVSVLFLLIPIFDRLFQLLQFASASLLPLASLIYTWLVLFIIYAICMNQIFGLTRISSNTTGNINCRTVTKTLILLFKMSFGEAWNYVMEDMMLGSPYCTTGSHFDSDCGNVAFAYILFISWNILSMYIFLNILISVVINSFSYVYHHEGPHSLLTRDEIRKFKRAWNHLDPTGTGYIHTTQLQVFLRSLEGVLSYNIYTSKYTIPTLTATWIKKKSSDPYDIEYDLDALNNVFDHMDFKKVNERRKRYNLLVEEARLGMVKDEMISFTKVILLVAYYSRFEDTMCLTVEDFVRREIILRPIRAEKALAYIRMVAVRWIFNTKKKLNQNLDSFVDEDPFKDSSDDEDYYNDDVHRTPFGDNKTQLLADE